MLLHLVKSLINKTAKIGLQPKHLLTITLIINKCNSQFPSNKVLTYLHIHKSTMLYRITVLYLTFADLKVCLAMVCKITVTILLKYYTEMLSYNCNQNDAAITTLSKLTLLVNFDNILPYQPY